MTEIVPVEPKVEVPEIDIDEVFEEIEETKEELVTLSSGAQVRAKRVPDNLVLTLHRQNPAPKPPIVEIREEGRRPRREENPNDPDYVQALETYQLEIANKMTDLILLAGMEVVNLPKGMDEYDAEGEWVEELEAMGLDVPLGKASRRLLWIRYQVAPLATDLETISSVYARVAEVSEEGVEAKEEQFQG